MAQCEICGNEYRNLGAHKAAAHKDGVGQKSGEETVGGNMPDSQPQQQAPEVPEKTPSGNGAIDQVLGLLKNFDERLNRIENRNSGNEFKKGAKEDDISSARVNRETVDPKIVEIVNQVLGEDFGIEIEPNSDRPGFLFTLIVPQRLSDLGSRTRPILDENGKYSRDEFGAIREEEYFPPDRRSRAIASHQSYDAIREHAERVRSYIVSYFTKLSKPIPEFKLK